MEAVSFLQPIFPDRSPDELKKIAELRHKARTDHFYLGNTVLGFQFVESVHRGLFDAMLQKQPTKPLFEQDTCKNRLILWPRGHFKTSAEVVEIVQLILCFPNIRILLMSGKQPLAKEIFAMVKKQFEQNPKLASLFPEFCGDKLGNKSEFTVPNQSALTNRAPTLSIGTAKSVKAGSHYDVIFCDDFVHENNYQLVDEVQQSFLHVGPLLDPGGYMYVIGTRYSHDDLYGWIIDSQHFVPCSTYEIAPGWTEGNYISSTGTWLYSARSCWKKFLDTNGNVQRIERLFPQRFSVELLEEEQRKKPLFFSCQWENRPVVGGTQVFPPELLVSKTIPLEKIPEQGVDIVLFDTATGITNDADETVGIAARIGTNGRVYIIDCVAGKFLPDQTVQSIVGMVFKWRPVKLYIEKAAGAVYLEPLLWNYCQQNHIQTLPLEWIKPKNTKDAKPARIMALQSLMQQDRLFFYAGLPNLEAMFEQFQKYPVTKHDDYCDTVAMVMELAPLLATTVRWNYSVPQTHPTQTFQREQEAEANPFGGLGGLFHG